MVTTTGILYLDKTKFELYLSAPNAVFRFDFPQETVKYGDVLNREIFLAQLKTFITTNKLQPARLTVVVSQSLIFSFHLETVLEKDRLQLSKKYADSVPYEDVLQKNIVFGKSLLLVAMNKELINIFKEALLLHGYIVESILPAFVFGIDAAKVNGLDAGTISTFSQKSESLKEYDLLQNDVASPSEKAKTEAVKKSPTNQKRQVILIIVFVLLLAVLGVVAYTTLTAPLPPPPVPATQTPNS